MLYFYDGDLPNAQIFHRLALYESEECLRDPTFFDYDKFKYDLYVEIERKGEEAVTVTTSQLRYNSVPKTPIEVPKLYKDFNKNSICKNPNKPAFNSNYNAINSTEKRLMYKSVRNIDKFKPLFLSTNGMSPTKCFSQDEDFQEAKNILMKSPYNRNHYTHLSKDRKKLPAVSSIIVELKQLLIELIKQANIIKS
jgi:hypothetical protein